MLAGAQAQAQLWALLQSIAHPSGRGGHSMALLSAGRVWLMLVVHGDRTKDSKLCKGTWVLELTS